VIRREFGVSYHPAHVRVGWCGRWDSPCKNHSAFLSSGTIGGHRTLEREEVAFPQKRKGR
jgi:hypothetical protein